MAFSGVQAVARSQDMVELDQNVFGPFSRCLEGKGKIMVDAALLQLFLSFYVRPDFNQKVSVSLNLFIFFRYRIKFADLNYIF